jgi:ATP-dependent helicase HrpA
VVGERGNVIAESRDIAVLVREHVGRARDAVRSTRPAPEWERTGLTSWDFGDLPPFVTRQVLGTELRSYPALVDRQKTVDLTLLESSAAAESATRKGVRRLLALAARAPLAAVAKRIPAPFTPVTRTLGMPFSPAETAAFRELVSSSILSAAFPLSEGVPLPRTQAAFDALYAAGRPRIDAAADAVLRAVSATAAELDKTLRALESAAKHPSGTHAARDIRAQIERLFPANLLTLVDLERLEQFPRYLRAAQARLLRAITDPRKDADKLAPVAPVWAAFLAKEATARDQKSAQALRWAFEELRVATFAPELKPALSVSVASLSVATAALR